MSTEGDFSGPTPDDPQSWEGERAFPMARPSRRRTSEHTCEATLARGARCHFAAQHHHRTQAGELLALCGVHLRTILRRERLGSDEELTARWRER